MSVKERLIEYLKAKNLSKRAFSRSIGKSETYISSMRKSITSDVVHTIAEQYPDLNTTWLLTGKGEMLALPTPEKEQQESTQEKVSLQGDIVVSREAWEMIKLQNKTIQAQQETIQTQQETIHSQQITIDSLLKLDKSDTASAV